MKLLRAILLIVLCTVMLAGCTFYFQVPMEAVDVPPETTELPIVSDVLPHIKAENVYWGAKFAPGDRANQYTLNTLVQMQYSDGEIELPATLSYNTDIMLDADACAVNIMTDVAYRILGEGEVLHYRQYYRDEDGRLICYFLDEQTGECTREVIDLDGYTPYSIILEYTIWGYPYYIPDDLTLEPQTRLLNGREVYVLTYSESALNVLGYTGNERTDKLLEKRWIPAVWYVDVETEQPVRIEYALSAVDDLLGQIIAQAYGVESTADERYIIGGFSFVIGDMCFEAVEVPQIPEDILQNAWQNAGFHTT